MGPKTKKIFAEQFTMLEAGIPTGGGIPQNKAAPATPQTNIPGTTLRSKVGGFLNKVGSAYNKLQSGSEKFKQLGQQGDLGVLKELGDKMLAKQLDIDTDKASLFGTKGYTKLQIVDKELLLKLNNVHEDYSEKTDKIIREMFGDLIPLFELRKTSKSRRKANIGRDLKGQFAKNPNPTGEDPSAADVDSPKTPEQPPEPEDLSATDVDSPNTPTVQPEPEDLSSTDVDNPNVPKARKKPEAPNQTEPTENEPGNLQSNIKVLNFIITKKDNAIQKGIPFTLAPADEETKQVLAKNNLSYAKFVKRADSENEMYNSGAIYFYNTSNQYAPDFTEENINFTYKAPNYVMGRDIQANVFGNIDNPKLVWFADTPKSNHKIQKLDRQHIQVSPKVDVNKLLPEEQKIFANGPIRALVVTDKAYRAYLQQDIYPVLKDSIEPISGRTTATPAPQAPKTATGATAAIPATSATTP